MACCSSASSSSSRKPHWRSPTPRARLRASRRGRAHFQRVYAQSSPARYEETTGLATELSEPEILTNLAKSCGICIIERSSNSSVSVCRSFRQSVDINREKDSKVCASLRPCLQHALYSRNGVLSPCCYAFMRRYSLSLTMFPECSERMLCGCLYQH